MESLLPFRRLFIAASVTALITTVSVGTVFAQDAGDTFSGGFSADGDGTAGTGGFNADAGGDGFAGGFGTDGFDDASSDGSARGFSSFGGDFSLSGGGSSLEWNGSVEFDLRTTVDEDDPLSSVIDGVPSADIELSWSGAHSDVLISGSGDSAGAEVDQAYLTLYHDAFSLSTGLMKTVWGSGDGVHVVDLLNSSDYTDFINPDYIDRRIAVPMALVRIPFGETGQTRLEVAWVPTFTPDTYAETGAWAADDVALLSDTVEGYATALAQWYIQYGIPSVSDGTLAATDTIATTTARSLAAVAAADAIRYEETNSLAFSQFGARLSTSLGGVDAASTVYQGFVKTPSPEVHFANSTGTGPSTEGYLYLDYDPLWAFGIDAATAVSGVNLRGEVAYYLTDDIDGDDPSDPNNSIEYLAGFDFEIPGVGTNINVQLVGSYLLHADEIDDAGYVANGTTSSIFYDPSAVLNYQWDADGIYTRNMVSVALTDSFAKERILPTASVAMELEHGDYRISSSVEFVLRDDARIEIGGVIYGGDEAGMFGQYDDNDYLTIAATYAF